MKQDNAGVVQHEKKGTICGRKPGLDENLGFPESVADKVKAAKNI